MKQFALINALLAIAALEASDEGSYLNEEQLGQIDAELAAKAQAIADLAIASTAKQDAEAAKALADTELATANTTIEALNAEIATLKTKPGATSAKAVIEKDTVDPEAKDQNVVSESKSFMDNLKAVKEEYL